MSAPLLKISSHCLTPWHERKKVVAILNMIKAIFKNKWDGDRHLLLRQYRFCWLAVIAHPHEKRAEQILLLTTTRTAVPSGSDFRRPNYGLRWIDQAYLLLFELRWL